MPGYHADASANRAALSRPGAESLLIWHDVGPWKRAVRALGVAVGGRVGGVGEQPGRRAALVPRTAA